MSAEHCFQVGDLVADYDVFGTCIDLAVVLSTPRDNHTGHYKVRYCTGPVKGDEVYESPYAMQNFKVVSRRRDS